MPSHKRAAGSILQASTSQPSLPHQKKARFAEPSEDPQDFADQVDSALENPHEKRKGRVKQEGYDSDSSDDGEGVVLSRRKSGVDAGGGDADQDDDMFAMGEKEIQAEEDGSSRKKEEKFLRLGDIEGQEFGKSDSDNESGEGDEPEDEDDAERRRKAGMGYEMSSFNMREEMEEGKFAEDGTYVRTFDPHTVHDRWMDGVDDRAMKKARQAKRRHEREQKEKMRAEEQELASHKKEVLEKQLLPMLKKGESVLEALQRLGARVKKTRTGTKSTKAPNAMNVDKDSTKLTSDIDQITHLASSLMSLGDPDIYSTTYEELVRSVRSAGREDSSWIPPSADVKYEFRWDVPGSTSGEVFGPFSEQEMQTWFKAAYFGVGGEKVKIRETAGDWGDWDDVFS